MGNSIQCCASIDKQFLNKQLKMYRWRADYKSNRFIPRVFFKNKCQLEKEESYNKFIQQNQTKNYIDPYSFISKSQGKSMKQKKQVIVFQNYICTLDDIQNILNLEESVYVLQTLLLGFRQIRKHFDRFMVSSSCCFVNNNGQIRCWINYNPRLNQAEAVPLQETYLAEQQINIFHKIVQIVSRCSYQTEGSQTLFSFLKQNSQRMNNCVGHSKKYEDITSQLCQIIRIYKAQYQLKKVANILQSLNYQKSSKFARNRLQLLRNGDSILRISQKYEQNPTCASYVEQRSASRQFDRINNYKHKISLSPNNDAIPYTCSQFIKIQTEPHLISKSACKMNTQYAITNQAVPYQNKKLIKNTKLQHYTTHNIHQILQRNSYQINDGQQLTLMHKKINRVGEKQFSIKSDNRSKKSLTFFKKDTFNTLQQIGIDSLHVANQTSPWMVSTKTISKLISSSPSQNNMLESQGSSYESQHSEYSGILLNIGRNISQQLIQ